jgi:hypothetical protein
MFREGNGLFKIVATVAVPIAHLLLSVTWMPRPGSWPAQSPGRRLPGGLNNRSAHSYTSRLILCGPLSDAGPHATKYF